MQEKLKPVQGRPLVAIDKALNVVIHIRASHKQQQKLILLGGAVWVRKAVDKAKLPDTK